MRALQISMVALLAACGTEEAVVVDGPLEPAAPDGGQQLATSTYMLQPGEERYMCYQFYSPDDAVAITHVDQLSMPGVHHFALFQAFGRNEPDEAHECNTLIKQTWLPIWVSGAGSHDLTTPAGTGFVIAPATQYIVQLHLQNSGDEPLEVRGGANLTYERDVAAITPAGMYAVGSFALEIPANASNYQVPVSCQPGKDMHVFGVLPHMHKLGAKIEMTRGSQPFYTADPWSFGNQPLDMLDATVTPTDTFDLTCSYNNPTNAPVKYGESSDDEMCFFVFFYYPYDHLDGCIIGG
jgi:hypothetical protein